MKSLLISQDAFSQALGGDVLPREFSRQGYDLQTVGTRGLAWLEPMIETEDGLVFGPFVSGTSFDQSLDSSHSCYLGKLDDLPFYRDQLRLVFKRCGTDDPISMGPSSTFASCLAQDPVSIIADIRTSNLRGRGGAGFPAHIKWETVANQDATTKYVVCNADEGDSGTFSDRLLMEGDPYSLIEGMVIAGYATGAQHGIIYLRSEYPHALSTLTKALSHAREKGYLGSDILGSGFDFDIDLFVGAGAYICGEETSLLESLEGKRGEIRAKPPLPAHAGLLKKPTLVHNVITLGSIPGIFETGAENYRELGVGNSTGTMPFQLSGNIKHGGLVELPFGHTVRELIEGFGAGTYSGRPLRAVQIGGPLGAYLSESELDTPITYEAMAGIGAGIGHGGLVAFDDSVDLAEQAEYAFDFCAIESCGKCTPCRIGSVRGRETVQQIRQGHEPESRLELIEDLCEVMEKTSLCQMGGMTPIPVRSAIQRFPEDFQQQNSIHVSA